MPLFDRKCESCGQEQIDCLEPSATPDFACSCGGLMKRVWMQGRANAVIGDEIDVTISHGMCNMDGTPCRWRSREALNKEMKRRGVSPLVRHVGEPGSDKSTKTSRWI